MTKSKYFKGYYKPLGGRTYCIISHQITIYSLVQLVSQKMALYAYTLSD